MSSELAALQRVGAVLGLRSLERSGLVDIDQSAADRRSRRFAPSRVLQILYWLYERRLLRQLQGASLPRHVGIILDGNRRHGRRRGIGDPREIYECGADKLNDVLDWCVELGITAVTLWVFSTENLKRSPGEISGILAAIQAKMAALAHDPFMHAKRIRVRAIGRLDILPESTLAAIRAAEAATAEYNATTLTIAAAYGGREEIVDAVSKFLKSQAKQGASLTDVINTITSDSISRHLYAADLPDPDLIIRTSGEIRLSGFLLWQSVHSEYYFTDVLWPALRKVDFLRAIRAYQGRNRRFGR
jgi:short-chain Z-isoprenyl diphosphate synthase